MDGWVHVYVGYLLPVLMHDTEDRAFSIRSIGFQISVLEEEIR